MDMLSISKLKIMTRIGVHAWEQQIEQPLLLDIQIPLDLSQCQDQLDNTIDYSKLCETVTNFVSTNSFVLIETVASKTAELIKKEFAVTKITVSVSKPYAIKNAQNVSVTISR